MAVKQIKESGTLVESSAENKSNRRWRAKIIEAGQGSSAFYPERVLEDYASVFKTGTQMYFDHPTMTEDFDRPERSVKDLVGKLVSEAEYEDGALYADVEFYSWAAPVINEMAEDIGLSIRAFGTAEDNDEGTQVLTSFVEVVSVDVVTKAGAGGALVGMLESARTQYGAEKTITPEADKAKKESKMNEEQEALLKQVAESINNLAALMTPVVESLAPKKEDATPDPIEVGAALSDSGLTESGRKAVVAAVKSGTALTEAIKAQKDYEDSIVKEALAHTERGQYHVEDIQESDKPVTVGFKKAGK